MGVRSVCRAASAPHLAGSLTCVNSNVLLIRMGMGGGRGKQIGQL